MSRPYGASIESDIGFADGELLSYERTSTENLSVTLTAWDESQITVLLGGVIAVLDLGAGRVSNLVTSAAADAELLGLALERHSEGVPSVHPYRSYSFLNHDKG